MTSTLKKIVVKRSNGGVHIVKPGDVSTPETMLKDALATKDYVSHREIDDDKFPSDRLFRDAWTDDLPTDTVDIDLDKARSIIREHRNASLVKLDTWAYAESRNPKGSLTWIDIEAQRLRDIPQDPDFKSNSVDILKTVLEKTKIKV